ncbi:MAG: P-loop NTPase, partial [Mobilitalea sp.]
MEQLLQKHIWQFIKKLSRMGNQALADIFYLSSISVVSRYLNDTDYKKDSNDGLINFLKDSFKDRVTLKKFIDKEELDINSLIEKKITDMTKDEYDMFIESFVNLATYNSASNKDPERNKPKNQNPDNGDEVGEQKKANITRDSTVQVDNKLLESWFLIDKQHKEEHGGKVDNIDKSIVKFLKGSSCLWKIIYSNLIVRRDIVDTLIEEVEAGGIILLFGAGGEGKSTALKQMCVELSDKGEAVLFHKDKEMFEPNNKYRKVVFVVDNPPNDENFKYFYQWAFNNEVTLVIGCRANEWSCIARDQKLSNLSKERSAITMPSLTDEEAERFAECVEKYRGSLESTRSKEDMVNVFKNKSYGFLYASMLIITKNADDLDDIAKNIVEQLNENAQNALKLLSYVVLSEQIGVPFAETELTLFILSKKIFKNKNEALKSLELEVKCEGREYKTRHPAISDLFFKYIFNSNDSVLPVDLMSDVWAGILLRQHKVFESFGIEENVKKLSKYNRETATDKLMENVGSILSLSKDGDEATRYYLIKLSLECFESPFLCRIADKIADMAVLSCFLKECLDREKYVSSYHHSDSELLIKIANIVKKGDIQGNLHDIYKKSLKISRLSSELLKDWANYEINEGNLGNIEDPEEHTARWIFHQAYMKHQVNGNDYIHWAKSEEENGEVGDFKNPVENSARWIFRQAYTDNQMDGNVYFHWAKLEQKNSEVGDFENPVENSARWIFRQAYTDNQMDGNVYFHWAKLEQKNGEVGDFENPVENSARWIFRQAYKKQGINQMNEYVYFHWARLEQENGEFGDFENPIENSARWIFRQAYKKQGINQMNGYVYFHWARLEQAHGEFGDFENPIENSARWIFRQAYKKQGINQMNGYVYFHWARLEQENGEVGDFENPIENSARWIFRQAYKKQGINQMDWNVYIHWARLEQENGEFGDFENPMENSARWIYRQAYKKQGINQMDWNVLANWARLEQENGEFGVIENPIENSARWIYRQAY